ncbi:MAG: Fic family protein [Vulcanimicrobiaceae bacterium]|jgi:Fic family protein
MTVHELRAEMEARPDDAASTRRFERVRRDVIYDEIAASCALADAHLTPLAVRRLLERNVTVAGSLPDHLLVLGYARAALEIAREHRVRPGARWLISVAEIERLHVTIMAPLDVTRPRPALQTAWRRTNLPPVREGMVTTPHWLIEFEMSTLVERIGSGPPREDALFTWLADACERLERIRPFVEANGRIARLVMNLLLSRLGYPPATITHTLVDSYTRALSAADAGDRTKLADLLERAVRTNLERLTAAIVDTGALRPLASFVAHGLSLDALRKAAQRGRLRVVTRGREILTTQVWIDAYRATKSKAGRPVRAR